MLSEVLLMSFALQDLGSQKESLMYTIEGDLVMHTRPGLKGEIVETPYFDVLFVSNSC